MRSRTEDREFRILVREHCLLNLDGAYKKAEPKPLLSWLDRKEGKGRINGPATSGALAKKGVQGVRRLLLIVKTIVHAAHIGLCKFIKYSIKYNRAQNVLMTGANLQAPPCLQALDFSAATQTETRKPVNHSFSQGKQNAAVS